MQQRTLAMLVGGGPAPGLNGVINAVTLAARARGWNVLGVPKGFSQLMKGDISNVRELTEKDVAGIETRGGSILFTSRANPTKKPEDMQKVVESLKALGVTDLVTLGGDDTATSATKVAAASGAGMRAVHVPKTIDNDLPLPGQAPTFGFETAKYWGSELCKNLRVDAQTTGRWYLITAMGRSAGHLALSMAVGSGSQLVVIPEEFPAGTIRLSDIADLVEAAIAKRRVDGSDWGVVVLAEGLLDRMDAQELASFVTLEYDEHNNARLSEIDLGRVVRDVLLSRFKERKLDVGFITKIIGYELRCADPVAFDVQYTRTLGVGAVDFLANGQGHGLISVQDGKLVPIRFEDLRDPATGKVRIRRVDPQGAAWLASLPLQARLRPDDLQGARLEAFAKAAKLTPQQAQERFGALAKA
ncbi:MAG: ATP-dependent phosphofructokinase / diphosphate-dependent phosphofructokinase [Thermoplasmata archaeon]|jgi:6-phosphofructokinase 1|nr:ATP-dependent phosphofructokinase / diphosphate-dependent phosphofructokinase [Thermoplasmata archaeon]